MRGRHDGERQPTFDAARLSRRPQATQVDPHSAACSRPRPWPSCWPREACDTRRQHRPSSTARASPRWCPASTIRCRRLDPSSHDTGTVCAASGHRPADGGRRRAEELVSIRSPRRVQRHLDGQQRLPHLQRLGSSPARATALATEYAKQYVAYRQDFQTTQLETALHSLRTRIARLRRAGATNTTLYASLVDRAGQLAAIEAVVASGGNLVRAAGGRRAIRFPRRS